LTTVIACRSLKTMIADSNISHGEVKFKSTKKVQRIGKYLVGVAGDYSHALRYAQAFAEKAKEMDGKAVPLLEKMDGEFELMVLSEHGLWLYGDDGTPLEIEDEFYVIGTGTAWATSCLRTQELLCAAYNLEMAMEVACEFDNDSRLPAVTYTLGRKRKNDPAATAPRK
jgi:ATP-dependent protease HslVU (ClpYQ) peptidase subunit